MKPAERQENIIQKLSDIMYYELEKPDEVKKRYLLSREEEKELSKLVVQHDSTAIELFVYFNTGLVHSIAMKNKGRGLELEDMVQEGNRGILKALEKFDSKKGIKFSTYAQYWISFYIKRAIQNKSNPIRLPVYMHEKHYKYRKLVDSFTQNNSCTPSDEYIKETMNVSSTQLNTIKKSFFKYKSIDSSSSTDSAESFDVSEEELQDVDRSSEFNQVDKQSYLIDLKSHLLKVLEYLPEEQKQVINLYFGLNEDGTLGQSISSISKQLNTDPARTRKTLNKALRTLQHPAFKQQLERFYEEEQE